VNQNFFAVSRHNAGAFLAAMLEGIQSEIDKLSGVLVAENPTDAAFMPGFYREFTIGLVGVHVHCLHYGQDAPKIERHKGRFLVPVLLSIQPSQEVYLQPDYTFFFNKISGIVSEYYNKRTRPTFSWQKNVSFKPIKLTATVKAAG
jgi:hypothetical protein